MPIHPGASLEHTWAGVHLPLDKYASGGKCVSIWTAYMSVRLLKVIGYMKCVQVQVYSYS